MFSFPDPFPTIGLPMRTFASESVFDLLLCKASSIARTRARTRRTVLSVNPCTAEASIEAVPMVESGFNLSREALELEAILDRCRGPHDGGGASFHPLAEAGADSDPFPARAAGPDRTRRAMERSRRDRRSRTHERGAPARERELSQRH